ncbi:ATP-binding protein [Streptomyces sp. NPDC003023]|uniref:ATP-binding protein n=1 Tax=Streptomyces sp. NPDC003023 TaxID=3364675 RepID=UPI00368C0AC3
MRGHLPTETTSFIGRVAELNTLRHLIGTRRLVTVTGPGGVGKTRLALHAVNKAAEVDGVDTAAEVETTAGVDTGAGVETTGGRFPDGVWWADLSVLQGDGLLVPVVSEAVNLSDHTSRTPVDALCEWLAPQRLLLVLDSCEHLVGPCGRLVADLLTAAPGLTVVATGRQPLGLAVEYVLRLDPLLSDGSDARELFTDRVAPSRRPALPEETKAVTDICHRLEGIPLAIELAAAQVGVYGVEGVRDRLGSRFEVLERAEPVRPPRHQALRTTIGWSHELCEPRERLLWARLTVFRDGFTPGDATRVCTGGPLTEEDVPAALRGLVAKSVVRREGNCYRMLDTIREYGRWWLEAIGEQDAVADRHADLCLGMVRLAESEWVGAHQAYWYERIAGAHTDLCTAMEHLLATDPRRALELAGSVGFFWACCGHLHEARGFVERALARCGRPGPRHVRALWTLGVALTLQGEYDLAHLRSEQCTQAALAHGRSEDMLDAAYLAGVLALLTGRPEEAEALMRSLDLDTDEDFGDTAAGLRCRLVEVFALTAGGRPAQARAAAYALRERCARHGESWTRSYLSYQLALLALLDEQPRTAAAHARAMLVGKRGLGDSFGVALGLDVLAAALAAQGLGEDAAYVFGTSETYWRATGHPQRGMPELGAMRRECERAARTAAGDDRYETAFRRGASGLPEAGLTSALRLADRA